MAYANYQTPTKITFYPSYLQYAYATGLIGDVSNNIDLNDEDIYKMIVVDPSNVTNFITSPDSYFSYNVQSGLNFDFGMILGHNFSNAINYIPYSFSEDGVNPEANIEGTGIVNYVQNTNPQYNGWSSFNLANVPSANWIGFNAGQSQEHNTYIGSVLIGKKWEAPQNIDINNNISYSYGAKQKKTIGGKTLSQMNYYKTNKWGSLDAWELNENISDEPTDSRNGIRSWNVSWSMLQDNKVLPQNAMQNSNAWTIDDDAEYSIGADGTSLYNSTDGIDFYTSVLKMTMGSHLPVVIKISESNNPDQWAVVRIAKHKISQKNPKFIDISLTLEEQV